PRPGAFSPPGKKSAEDRRHQHPEVLRVEILVGGGEGVPFDQVSAREDTERLSGGASPMARDRPRLRDDSSAGDPLAPAEIDVLEIGEIVPIETTRREKLPAAHSHEAAAGKEPLLAGLHLWQFRHGEAYALLKRVAVESQKAVGEIVLLSCTVNQPPGDSD